MDINEAIKMYNEGNSVTSIAKHFCVDRHCLSDKLKKAGVEISRTSSKYKYNEGYFDTIDTPEKAYFLGFMYADGYVSIKDNKVEFTLKNEDGYMVKTLRDILVPGKPIQIRKADSSIRLSITNKYIAKSLYNKGCVDNKSLILVFPDKKILPHHLERHFIRGYFDGDGCVHFPKERTMPNVSILGTNAMLSNIQDILVSSLGITKVSILNKGSVSEYRKTGNDAIKIIKYMYDDCDLYLKRKYEKCTDYIDCPLTSTPTEEVR